MFYHVAFEYTASVKCFYCVINMLDKKDKNQSLVREHEKY